MKWSEEGYLSIYLWTRLICSFMLLETKQNTISKSRQEISIGSVSWEEFGQQVNGGSLVLISRLDWNRKLILAFVYKWIEIIPTWCGFDTVRWQKKTPDQLTAMRLILAVLAAVIWTAGAEPEISTTEEFSSEDFISNLDTDITRLGNFELGLFFEVAKHRQSNKLENI